MASQNQKINRNNREAILAAVRSSVPPACEIPSLEHDWIQYPDPVKQFSTVLHSVGAQCFQMPDALSVQHKVLELQVYQDAKQLISHVPGVGRSTLDLSLVTDPHQLEMKWSL